MEYTFERIGPQHFDEMRILFKHCFRRSVAKDFFKKKFETEKFGLGNIGFVAYTKDKKLAASYGLYPCKIVYKHKQYSAAISGDSMTHEAHRGKKLFDTLARMTYDLAKEKGIKFMYCFPNQNTFTGSVKLGWQYGEENMFTYSIKVAALPFSKFCRKFSILNSIYKSHVRLIFNIYSRHALQFENSLAKNDFAFVKHDSDFFSYKTYSQNTVLKIADRNCWVKMDGELKIGDVENAETDNYVRLIKKLKRIAFVLGCNEIQLTVCEESDFHEKMKTVFPNTPSFKVGRIDFGLDFPKEKVKFTMADFDTF